MPRLATIVTLTRAQIGRAAGIDTTVKSSQNEVRYFSPTWEMVMGHKAARITDEEYTSSYIKILDRVPKPIWRWLWQQGQETGTLTVLCYCRDEWFCHTHLLIDYAITRWPKAFRR
jgi:hypothetical protein